MIDEENVPHWTVNVTRTEDKITKIGFTIDVDPPLEEAYQAMRKLTAVAMWWCANPKLEGEPTA